MGVPVIKQAAIVVGLLTLCACSGGSTPSTDAAGTAATTSSSSSIGTGAPATAGETSPAAAATTSADPDATKPAKDGSSAVSIPDQLCVFLDQEQIKVKDLASGSGAQARLATDFKTWKAKDRNRTLKKADVDAISSSQCPKVRSRILAAVGSKSITAALS
jgi:hypothetical protein